MSSSSSLLTDGEQHEQEQPRLCHIKKLTLEQGYGFSIKRKTPSDLYPMIDRVEMDSPAHRAGLKSGDLIVEVNYYDIRAEGNKDVLKIIRYGLELDEEKVNENEVVLLVVDKNVYDHYMSHNIKLGSMCDTNVRKIEVL